MKKFISIILAFTLCIILGCSAYAVVDESDEFYVADYANVLSNQTEQMIINYNGALEQQCQGAQIVVVTVDYLDGMYCDEYAYQLFNDWGVGSADYDNGMLLLLSTQENKAWLAYGLGLNSSMNPNKADELLNDYFWNDFDRGEYDSAVTKLFNALLKWYDSEYSSSTATSGSYSVYNEPQPSYGSDPSSGSLFGGISTLTVIILIIVVITIISSSKKRRRTRRYGVNPPSTFNSALPWILLGSQMRNNNRRNGPPRGGGFGSGGGFGGGGFNSGSGFGGGHGGGGFSGGGGGRR